MRAQRTVMVLGVLAVALTGCGGSDEGTQQEESAPSATAAASQATLPAVAASPSAGVPNGTPAPSTSPVPTAKFGSTATPGKNDVGGRGVIAPSPSPAVPGDGRQFDGFADESSVDRSSTEAVAVEAMRSLAVWDTTVDTKPQDAGARVSSLVTKKALERSQGPGRWTPMWWRQATAAGAWSSVTTKVVPADVEVDSRPSMTWVGVDLEWEWHAPEGSVVPEGGSRSCTVAVEKVAGKQTVTAYDCEESTEAES